MPRLHAFAVRALFLAAAVLPGLAASAQACASRHYLWEVASPTNRVYLFGTIHAGAPAWYPLPAPIQAAFDASGVLVVEADITDPAALARASAPMSYTPPDTLANHVAPADYARLVKLLPRYAMTEAQVAGLKPFFAASMLAFGEWARLGYHAQHGIDAHLIARARAAAKPVVELEGIDAQARLIAALTDADHRGIFSGTLDALESGLAAGQIAAMVGAWHSGDATRMLEIARRYNERVPGASELERRFVWARHGPMLEEIEGYLNRSRDRHFIAVGSLHLSGPEGLVELLRGRGYQVRQL